MFLSFCLSNYIADDFIAEIRTPRNQSFDLQCISNKWFIYEMQCKNKLSETLSTVRSRQWITC